jgi:hypothetical protein
MKKLINKIVIIVTTFFSIHVHAQNVGIGTTTPSQKLEVAGNTFVRDSVGIGVATPKQKLDVAGNAYMSDSVGIGVINPQFKLEVGGRMRINSKGDGNEFESAGVWFNNADNTEPQAFIGMQTDGRLGLFASGLGSWGLTMNTLTGNVGVGNSNPSNKLEVVGNLVATGNVGIGNINPTNKLDVAGNIKTTGNIIVAGNVGIGNANPASKLDVTGNTFVSGNMTNGGDLVTFGKIGIGNPFPMNKLDVSGSIGSTGSITANGTITSVENLSSLTNITAGGNITAGVAFDIGLQYVVASFSIPANNYGEYQCGCPSGKRVIAGGGGHNFFNTGQQYITVNASSPRADGFGWILRVRNLNLNSSHIVDVWAICAKVQ